MPSMRKVGWRGRLSLLAALALVLGTGYLVGERYAARDWLPWFRSQKGSLVSVTEVERQPVPEGALRLLQLADDRGLIVNVQVREPPPDERPHPVLLTLGGINSGGRVAGMFPDTGRIMLVSIDYPYEGRRRRLSAWEFITRLPAMRRAVMLTPPATMLVLDYLYGRDDVDRQRIVLVGGSFGALLAPAAAAAESRISGLAILLGAGDLQSLIEANIDVPAPLEGPVAWAVNLVVSPVEPLKYIHRVAPRPSLLVSGTGDRRMPEALGQKLHDQARQPRTSVWLEMGHATLESPEFRALVAAALAEWLVETGFLSPADAEAVRSLGVDRS